MLNNVGFLIKNDNMNKSTQVTNNIEIKQFKLSTEKNEDYLLTIQKTKSYVFITYLNYEITLTLNTSFSILKEQFNSLNEIYSFFIKSFSSKNVNLILNNDIPKLKINNIILDFIKKNSIFIPSSIRISNSSAVYWQDNSFVVFQSFNDIIFLVYATNNYSILCYNLTENQISTIIKNDEDAKEYISSFRHILFNKKDLIMSIFMNNNHIKVWDVLNWNCILNLKNIYKEFGFIVSACFLNYENNIYILTSIMANYPESIYVFDLSGKKIKEIDKSNEETVFIDTYYDSKNKKNFVFTGNKGFVKSYDFENNNFYKKYFDDFDCFSYHNSILIFENNDKLNLIESSDSGFIRIWDFHKGELINKIKIENTSIYSICLWDKNNLFIGCRDKEIKLVDIEKGAIVRNLIGHNSEVICVKKIHYNKCEEYLVSQGFNNDGIILWIEKR